MGAAAAKWMMQESGLSAIMPELPESVDLSIRSGGGKVIYILTNYGKAPITVSLPFPMEDLLGSGTVKSVTLSQYGVAVVDRKP